MLCAAFPEATGGLPALEICRAESWGRSLLQVMSPIQQGHCTLKKVGSQASKMAVFQHAFHVFLMLTTVESHHIREYSLVWPSLRSVLLGTCPEVFWLFQVAPEMAR